MRIAISYAEQAGTAGEIPVGAIIVKDGEIISCGKNDREQKKDALGHAEINAIISAQRSIGDWRLDGCTIYVTLEPCCMCAGAIINSRIERVVYGASDDSCGCFGSKMNLAHCGLGSSPKITSGVLKEECQVLLRSFFERIRNNAKE